MQLICWNNGAHFFAYHLAAPYNIYLLLPNKPRTHSDCQIELYFDWIAPNNVQKTYVHYGYHHQPHLFSYYQIIQEDPPALLRVSDSALWRCNKSQTPVWNLAPQAHSLALSLTVTADERIATLQGSPLDNRRCHEILLLVSQSHFTHYTP